MVQATLPKDTAKIWFKKMFEVEDDHFEVAFPGEDRVHRFRNAVPDVIAFIIPPKDALRSR